MLSFFTNKQAYFYLLLLVAIGIALQSVIYKLAIIALLLQWLIGGGCRQKVLKLRQNSFGVGLIGLYFLFAISFFWSDNKMVSIIDLVVKSPLLILPLIILSQKKLSAKQINQVFLSFALSSCILNLFCLGDAFFSYIKTRQINEFYYYNLTLNMHTAYQAMFTSFSIVICFYLFIKDNLMSNWAIYFVIAIQIVCLLLLSSRMQILIMMAILPGFFIAYFYRQNRTPIGLLYVVLLFGFTYLIITTPSALNYRFKQTISQINSIGGEDSDPRKYIWNAGIQVIKKDWLIGSGNGDAKDLLLHEYSKLIIDDPFSEDLVDSLLVHMKKRSKIVSYFKQGSANISTYEKKIKDYVIETLNSQNSSYKTALKREYNFHNQYLQTLAAIGVFGLILFCYILYAPFVLSIRNKDYFFVLFLVIVALSFLTESMLERQAGTSFFPFFYSIFLIGLNQNKHV